MSAGGFLELYKYIAAVSYDDLPEKVIDITKSCLMDTVGIMIGAGQVDVAEKFFELSDIFGDSGKVASIIGTNKKISITNAAFINGSLAEILEMQDGIRYGGVHPSSTVIPAVLALAQQRRLSGKDLIISVFAGYEFLGRLTKLIYPQPFWRGFNMTGVCGAFGAAVGCSKLLNFNEDQMANAVGICGLYSPISSRESFYHEIKPTHAGRASEAGLLSVLITEKDIQASKQVLETSGYGGICSRMIAECKDFTQITESLGSHFELEEVYFKPYPSCRHTHGSIQALLELLREHSIDPDNVAKVNVATYDVAKNAVGDRRPTSNSVHCTRQFSIPYVVCASLINQKFEVEEIFGGASRDHRLYEFMSKVEVSEDPKLTARYPDTTPSNVEITLKNDRRLSKLIELPQGDPRNPMSKIDLERKFRKLVVSKLGEEQTAKLLLDLSSLEAVNDVSRLISRLCVNPDYAAEQT